MKRAALAVNAEMAFLTLPFYARIERLHALGFRVGLWRLDGYDLLSTNRIVRF